MLNIFFGTDKENSERNVIVDASNRLDVGEFQFFQLGYVAWFGKEADIKFLEKCFFDYLLEDKTTSWARHYARQIIALDEKGKLVNNAPEYHRYDADIPQSFSRKSGIVKVFLVLFLFFLFIGIALFLVDGITPLDFLCKFPPCIWDR